MIIIKKEPLTYALETHQRDQMYNTWSITHGISASFFKNRNPTNISSFLNLKIPKMEREETVYSDCRFYCNLITGIMQDEESVL